MLGEAACSSLGGGSGNTYSGVAQTFAGRCGSFSYSVTGHVFDDDEGISMSGRKPEIDESSCRVRGYSAMHMELRYKYRLTELTCWSSLISDTI